jgi:N-methylhydantoinase A/oxoprolinase/acetone carboxylase beta subunit
VFSFLNPTHERRARDMIRGASGVSPVSLSSEVDPAFREYERTCVTAFDAYLKPVVAEYLANLEQGLSRRRSGRAVADDAVARRDDVVAAARQRPVRLFLSGPAAGVVGGLEAGRAAGFSDIITVDVGGTSCDIALITGGTPLIRGEGTIDGYPCGCPWSM